MPSGHADSTPPVPTPDAPEDEREVDRVIGTLVRLWGDRIGRNSIEITVRQSFERYQYARVRDFVGLLAERSAREELRRRVGS